ncbi:hypothetical protein [Brevundimonas goettingensis]|uniref:Lipoprotein n=1 Tax=Brevundimonas goettingensis TaxID=2774190 RepID=A0A975C0D9_9CAUL|nr:hypothetical protein [Brevundimonas goettingensis]QTC91503.1 hypothetical protein IFJ75_00775 [Brevundimonas goettingensis]
MRAVKGLLLAAAITPLLGACVIYDGSGEDNVSVRLGSHTTTAWSDDSEVLRAVRFEPGALVVRAESNGCTEASSFAVEVSEGDGPTRLTLTRRSPDVCKALVPEGVELRWTYEELGLQPGASVSVTNPIRLP